MSFSLGGKTISNPLAVSTKNGAYPTAPRVSTANGAYPTVASLTQSSTPKTTSSAPRSTGGGGGGSAPVSNPTAVAAPVYVDPYAGTIFGSTAGYNNVHNGWLDQSNTTNNSIKDRISNDQGTYHSSVLDFDHDVTTGQRTLDEQGVQNELARQQGTSGVYDMVGHGVKSAGVVLANHPGASNSSATEAIARAYGDIGQRAMSQVGNQFANAQHALGISQQNFDDDVSEKARHLDENKTSIVNSIVSDATTQLAALNASAVNASLTDRIDIEARKTEIRNNAVAALSAYDTDISNSKGKAKAADPNSTRQKATQLATAGTAATNPFEYTSATPAAFQNTGPFSSELPVFSAPGQAKKNNT